MSNNKTAKGFTDLLKRAEQERELLAKEIIDRYEKLNNDQNHADSRVLSVGPPYVLVADEDPLAWVDSNNQYHPISIHFDLDETMIDEDRMPVLGELTGIIPSIPFMLPTGTVLLRTIPLHRNVAPPPPSLILPVEESSVWKESEELWATCEYADNSQLKLSVAKILNKFFQALINNVDGDVQQFEDDIREQHDQLINGIDRLINATLVQLLENEEDGEDMSLEDDDESLLFECKEVPMSDIQASAAEFIQSAFSNLKDYIDNFESDVGYFPFLVQRNEEEALFKLDDDGSICFLDESFDIPSSLLEQDVDGFISLEAPGSIGRLRFIPISGFRRETLESGSQLFDEDGLDLMAFGELESEKRQKVSLIWSIVTNPDVKKATRNLRIHKDEIEDVDQLAFVAGNTNMTPLMHAAAYHSKALVGLLLELGADPSRCDSAGFTPLTYSLQGEKLENFALLLEKDSDVNPVPSATGRYSPLAMAADHGLLSAVNMLIERGADVNWRSASGATAIKYAAAAGNVDCLKSLLDAGGDPLAFDDEGFSPIHNAADSGSKEVLSALLAAGVDVNLAIGRSSEDAGRTPLNRACAYGNRGAVEYLLQKGASANLVFDDAATCLSSTLFHAEVIGADHEAIVQALLDHNCMAGVGAMPAGLVLYLVLQKLSAKWVSRILSIINEDSAKVCGQDSIEEFRETINAALKNWINEESSPSRREEILAAVEELKLDWLTVDGPKETMAEVFSEIENNTAEAVLLCLSPMAIASVHEQQDPNALLEEINQYKRTVLPIVNRIVRRLIENEKIRGVLQTVGMMVSEASPLLEGLPDVHVDLNTAKMSANLISVFKLFVKMSSDEQSRLLQALCSKITAGVLKILIVEIMGAAMFRDEKVNNDEKHVLLTVMKALGMEQRMQEIVSGETSEGYAIVKTLIFDTVDVPALLFGNKSR